MQTHTNRRTGQVITANTDHLESDCSDISFVNQGTSTVTIFCGDSTAGRTLEPNEAVDFNNEIGGKEITLFRITFSAELTNSLYVERSYKNMVK